MGVSANAGSLQYRVSGSPPRERTGSSVSLSDAYRRQLGIVLEDPSINHLISNG